MKTTKIMQHLIGKTYEEVSSHHNIKEDGGDCCGWSECGIDDALENLKDKSTAVLVDVVEISYSEDCGSDFDRTVVNFVFDLGEQRGLILGYDLSAGSGSGYSYGAYVSLHYGDEDVAGASW